MADAGVREFKLPDVGEGLVEAEIVTWKVKAGDTVALNEIVVEIETAKSLVELPIPFAGTVAELLVPEGETVDVGTPIIAIATGAAATSGSVADPSAPTSSDAPRPSTGPADDMVPTLPDPDAEDGGGSGRTAVLVGYGPRTTEPVRRPRKGAAAQAPAVAEAAPVAAPEVPAPPAEVPAPAGPDVSTPAGRVLAKPPVRKYAKDHGIDLSTVTPTGPGGIVTRADVEGASAQVTMPATQSTQSYVPPSPGEVTRVPVKGVRKVTADAMVASAFTAPHVTEWITVDVSATMALVARLKEDRRFVGVRVSPLLIAAKAVCLAARRTPELNGSFDAAAGEIVLSADVNLGIAAATPRGLLVPNIKAADRLGLFDLCTAINELTSTARAGRTAPADQMGGTFTITNVGVFGVDGGTPILNPGEAGILALGAIRKQPWVVEGDRIEARDVMQLSLSFDHRIADGEQGSRFLADVAGILSDPGTALLF